MPQQVGHLFGGKAKDHVEVRAAAMPQFVRVSVIRQTSGNTEPFKAAPHCGGIKRAPVLIREYQIGSDTRAELPLSMRPKGI